MRRWIVVLSLVGALLASNVWNVHCGPQSEGMSSDLPDCCLEGMCPHHAGESKESNSCPHSMSSGNVIPLFVMAAMPVTIPDVKMTDHSLISTELSVEFHVNLPLKLSIYPKTPPPKH